MHYEIRRGHKTGKQLTPVQRASGTFAEEPIVLGRVMRRGNGPIRLTAEQFEQQKARLLRQLLSGSIEIFVIDENKTPARLDYKTARGFTIQAGEAAPVSVPAPETNEEPEVPVQPPSSAPVEPEVVTSPPASMEEAPPEIQEEPAATPEAEMEEAPAPVVEPTKRKGKREQA